MKEDNNNFRSLPQIQSLQLSNFDLLVLLLLQNPKLIINPFLAPSLIEFIGLKGGSFCLYKICLVGKQVEGMEKLSDSKTQEFE